MWGSGHGESGHGEVDMESGHGGVNVGRVDMGSEHGRSDVGVDYGEDGHRESGPGGVRGQNTEASGVSLWLAGVQTS